jgi:hypothetical protein
MTAKERADALQDALLWAEISGVDPRDTDRVAARRAVVIEKAFRETENDALDRAAELAWDYAEHPDPGECWMAALALQIRSLKSLPEGKEGEGRE